MSEPPSDRTEAWRQRRAEIDQAAAADADAAERARAAARARLTQDYAASPFVILIGFAVVALLVTLTLFVIERLENDPIASDCAMMHGNRC